MIRNDRQILFTASDLANHLGCTHATQLERQFIEGTIQPEYRTDPLLELLIELGQRHEADYVAYVKQLGKTLVEPKDFDSSSLEKTVQAMKDGVDVVYQAWLENSPWQGRWRPGGGNSGAGRQPFNLERGRHLLYDRTEQHMISRRNITVKLG